MTTKSKFVERPIAEPIQSCQEILGMIGSMYLRCGAMSTHLIQHRGRNEGPYWMCLEHAHHNICNRDAEDITPS